MEFSEKLIRLRKEKGWSQEELGNKIDVSRQTVSKWELGQTTPEMKKLVELSLLFGITLDELVICEPDEEFTDNRENDKSYQSGSLFMTPSTGRHYEYRSKRTIFGMPLVHVNLGRGMYKAKGIIAIGNVAVGLLSLGLFSAGVFSFGLFALGIFAFASLAAGLFATGGIAIGGIALGGVAVGYFTVGGLAIGVYGIGGLAIAKNIAMGGMAHAHIAIGDKVSGTYTFHINTGANFGAGADPSIVKSRILTEFPHIWKGIVTIFTSF
mgnify:CR=1 FL=1